MADNLWPTDFGNVDRRTPVGILREQARALGARTNNIVIGRVNTVATVDGKFRHLFSLFCAPLAYSMPLFHIDHGVDLYPVELFLEGEPGPSAVLSTEADFLDRLKDVFSRERTKQVIASLINQSKE